MLAGHPDWLIFDPQRYLSIHQVVTVMTDEDVPAEPSNLTLLAFTATQLKIGWEPPTNAGCSGTIKSYHVFLGMSYIDVTYFN